MTGYRKQPQASFEKKEKLLVERFLNCRLLMTPNAFLANWGITRAELAFICQVDVALVNRCLSRGKSHQKASPFYQRTLAMADIFLEFYQQFPPSLLQKFKG